MGGTFDPIHQGHVLSALQLKRQLALDQMRLLPCRQPPHRRPPACSAEHRLAMLKLALASYAELSVDTRELKRKGPSYTVDTLKSLREALGNDVSLAWVMGSDAWAQLDSWHHWQQVIQLANIIVLTRPQTSFQLSESVARLMHDRRIDTQGLYERAAGGVLSITLTPYPISATAIRTILAKGGEPPAGQLDAAVLAYIKAHGLYING